MKVMTDRQSVAANGTVANAVSGKLHEFIQSARAVVRLYGSASAVGLNMTLLVGGRAAQQDQEVNAQNRLPIVPDDFLASAIGIRGERILLSYRNTTGGAITAFSRVEVEDF